jgi:hypothetical protein
MDFAANLFSAGTLSQILVGLSRTTILFIVASGMSLILGTILTLVIIFLPDGVLGRFARRPLPKEDNGA